MTCGWCGIVRRPVTEQERRVTAPGIEFNAHCYQRREDATQPHCLAGLVTAGDIINRLRAPHLFPPRRTLLRTEGSSRMADGEGVGWKYTVFSIGKHHRFLVTRDLVIAVYRARGKWNSRGVPSLRERGLRCIYQKNEFAQGVDPQFTERK